MNQQELVAFLQKKIKQVGGVSLLTLMSIILLQVSRAFANKNPDSQIWPIVSILAIVLASLFGLLLLFIALKMLITMIKHK